MTRVISKTIEPMPTSVNPLPRVQKVVPPQKVSDKKKEESFSSFYKKEIKKL